MLIRMLVGRYSGEIRDVQNEAARMLMEKGAAENPYSDITPVVAEIAAPQSTATRRPPKTKRAKVRA